MYYVHDSLLHFGLHTLILSQFATQNYVHVIQGIVYYHPDGIRIYRPMTS